MAARCRVSAPWILGVKGRPDFVDVPEQRRANMRAIRGRHTRPEMVVRSLLHREGYRFRLHRADLPGRPDIVLPGRRRIVEVRGCFWHRHPDPACRNAVLPMTRAAWWAAKLAANVDRDERNLAALEGLGWKVLVIWECEVDRPDLRRRLRRFLGPSGAVRPRRPG
jgi:DNA mismatch endonuclease Vsr